MDSREYESAANYWIEKDAASKHMPREQFGEAIDAFLAAHNTCALATGAGSFVRNTPLEYNYFDGEIWIFSEGGLKFKALAQNKNVCLAIFDAYGAAPLAGMQIMGTAELVEDWSEEYVRRSSARASTPRRSRSRGMRSTCCTSSPRASTSSAARSRSRATARVSISPSRKREPANQKGAAIRRTPSVCSPSTLRVGTC